jgi:hypothetical protein
MDEYNSSMQLKHPRKYMLKQPPNLSKMYFVIRKAVTIYDDYYAYRLLLSNIMESSSDIRQYQNSLL